MAKRKMTQADREAREQMRRNAERTRQLAEKAQAELDARRGPQGSPSLAAPKTLTDREAREQMRRNTERTRQLAEKAQAELDARKKQSA